MCLLISILFKPTKNKPQDFGVEHFQYTNLNRRAVPTVKEKNFTLFKWFAMESFVTYKQGVTMHNRAKFYLN
mgnify:FL=1